MTYRVVPTCKTPFGTASFIIEHRFDGFEGAGRELVVVLFVPRGGPGEHDKIAILSAGRALLGIVL